ncbi:MAG: efflux RND transporter periplasmic adaptor subunit [Acidothermaceae bacterium]
MNKADCDAITTAQNLVNSDESNLSVAQASQAIDQSNVNNDKAVLADATKVASDATAITSAQNSMAAGQLRDQQTIDKDNESITNDQNNKTATLAKDQQSIKNAQQQVTNAQLSLETTKNGNAQKTASPLPSDVETDEAQIEQAQAQVASAQQTYDETTLTAPADGTIGSIDEAVGQSVSAGTTSSSGGSSSTGTGSGTSSAFMTLTNLTDLQVVADIDEADSSKVEVGSPATVTLNAITGKEFAAHVIEVADTSTVSSNVVEYQVTFQLDNTDPTIKPGMTASVSVTTDKVDGVLNVVSAAVHSTGGSSYVMVMQPDGSQKQVDVVVGLKGNTTTEISGDLKAGDTVALPTSTVAKSTTSSNTTTNNRTGGGTVVFPGGGGGFGGGFGGRG